MAEQNINLPVCPKGHRQPNADSRFCIYCGTPLNVQPVQRVQPPPVYPQQQPPPVNQNQNNIPQNQNRPPYQGGGQPVQNGNPPYQQPVPGNYQQPNQNNYQQQNQNNNYQQPNQNNNYQQPNQNNYQPPNQNNYQQQNQNNNYQQQNQYQQPVQNYQIAPLPVQSNQCNFCGGNGQRLDLSVMVCQECNWLRPLTPGYSVDCAAFQWAEDGRAMSALRSIKPLVSVAQTISNKVGRRWIEAMFNGVLLSEKQLPEVYAQAVHAGRILGMSHMPDVYVSGDVMWDCRTYGSDKDAFIVMGTALASNFRDQELLYLFAREMGHCRAGHALWKTVIRFLMGEQGPRKGLLAGGLFSALSPSALLEGAIEMPLLAWARQAEITADRAGLLAVGKEEIARRVLLSWSLKSTFLFRQINIEAWLEQQAESEDDVTRLAELTTSSTPYVTRRLKLMEKFAKDPDMLRWQTVIDQFIKRSAVMNVKPPVAPPANQPKPPVGKAAPPLNDDIKMKCSACGIPMRVPQKVLEGKEQIAIRCPNPKCKNLVKLKKRPKAAPVKSEQKAVTPNNIERNMNYDD